MNDRVKVLDDCLFCIHLQRQYSAARELEEFVKAKKDDSVVDVNAAKYFQALKVTILNAHKTGNFSISHHHSLRVVLERVRQRKSS